MINLIDDIIDRAGVVFTIIIGAIVISGVLQITTNL